MIVVMLVATMGAAACGSPEAVEPGGIAPTGTAEPTDVGTAPTVLVAAVDREAPDPVATDATVQGMTRFGHDLYTVAADPAENTILSPASIALAFALARAGAEGSTAEEIDAVLHFPAEDLHAAMNALDQAVVTVDGPPPRPAPEATREAGDDPQPPVVAIANGLFAQQGLEVEEPFLNTLASQYGAGLRTVDFTDPEAAKATIDAWTDEQTAGRIEELFAELDPRTLLVLANAVYLKADWVTPFVEYPIEPAPFTRTDGSVVDVPTMQQLGGMRYATGDAWQAVELPYEGGEFAMWVLVPEEGTGPSGLLAPEVLAEVDAGLADATVDLYLPRWDFETELDLIPLLSGLGMETPFTSAADFSGISPTPMWIAQAVHKANITVDEWGTEAAAVTGLGFEESGPPPPDVVVRADRPFAFVIRHTPTGVPLFAGHVADPSASPDG